MRPDVALLIPLALLLLGGDLAAQTVEPTAPKAPKIATPVLGAVYHADLRWPDRGFTNADGSDALSLHVAKPESVDGRKPEWHRGQIDAMLEAELDFVLFSWRGREVEGAGRSELAAFLEAWSRIDEAGGEPPRVALWLDPTSLFPRRAGDAGPSLERDADFRRLSDALIDFWKQVPPAARFELDGFLLVFVGANLGVPHGRDLFERLDERARKELRKPLFIAAERSWNARRPGRFSNDAALVGPNGDGVVQLLGPGYDDTRVEGRGTPRRDREDSRFYQWSWNAVLLRNPTVVVVDSWNDWRNGTAIAPTVEFGKEYVDLTRRYGVRLRNRMLPDLERPVRLAHPEPLPRPDLGWWTPPDDAVEARWRAGDPPGELGEGLRLARVEDGPWTAAEVAGRPAIRSPGPGTRYLYVGIADEFANRVAASFEVEVRFLDGGGGALALQYDSWDRSAALKGAYKSTPGHRRLGLPVERRAVFTLPDARFANRQNGGCDLRLVIRGEPLEILELTVRRLPKRLEGAPKFELR